MNKMCQRSQMPHLSIIFALAQSESMADSA